MINGNQVRKKEYPAVDLFKFICAGLVILIHVKPFESVFWIDAGVGLITRFAVPYFFIISAYFLFVKIKNSGESNKVFLNYVLRLLRFYTVWYLIDLLAEFVINGIKYDFLYYLRNYVININGNILWFINALIWASLITFLLSKFLKKKIVFVIAIIFFLIGYCFSTLRVLFVGQEVFDFINNKIIGIIGTQNGLFFAFPYVALGAVMAELSFEKAYKRDLIMIAVFFASLMAESFIAVIFIKADLTFLWISAIPMTYFVARLTLTAELKEREIYYLMRKSSTLIYVLHVIVLMILKSIFYSGDTALFGFDEYNILLLLMTVFFSLALSFGLVWLSQKKYFRFLRYIM